MLGKMIKHEFKATGRLFVPLFIMVIVLTPILSLLFKLSRSIGEDSMAGTILSGMSVGGFILMIVGFCVAGFIFIMVRFYKTVATSEAYLTFCLPVNQHHVILSKLIVSTVWQVITIAISVASIYVMLLINGIIKTGTVTAYLRKVLVLSGGSNDSLLGYLVKIGIVIFVSMIAGTLSWFLAICLGQLFNEHRVIASIAMYVAIYTVVQIISLIVMLPFIIDSSTKISIGQVNAFGIDTGANIPPGLFAVVAVMNVVFGVGYYIASTQILKKKTNVR